MTINVAVKCPDGIVMGADGLVTIPGEAKGEIASMVPYFTKLFRINGFAAGAMINGVGSIAGRTVEDIVTEFNEINVKEDFNNYSLEEVSHRLSDMIHQSILESRKPHPLEIIVGGYSKGEKARGKRYGEIYSIKWKNQQESLFEVRDFQKDYVPVYRSIYDGDRAFGAHYGGQPKILQRFIYGIDDWLLKTIDDRRNKLFDQAKSYIFKRLSEANMRLPSNFNMDYPKMTEFDTYSLISNYREEVSGAATMNDVKEHLVGKLETMEGYFSLQTAVNYCSFLMWCAYAQNAFTLVLPTVGSEMRIATITRDPGFKIIRQWDIKSPGPPFT